MKTNALLALLLLYIAPATASLLPITLSERYDEYIQGNEETIASLEQLTASSSNPGQRAVAHYILGAHNLNKAKQGRGYLVRQPRYLKQSCRHFSQCLEYCQEGLDTSSGLAHSCAFPWLILHAHYHRSHATEMLASHPTVLNKMTLLQRCLEEITFLKDRLATIMTMDASTEEIASLHRLEPGPLDMKTSLLLVKILSATGDYESGHKELEKVIDNNPPPLETQEALLTFSRHLIDKGSHDKALFWLSRWLEKREKEPVEKPHLHMLLLQATCLQRTGKNHDAMIALSKVINSPIVSSKRIEAMMLRASFYLEEGRKELAIKQLESVRDKGGLWRQAAEKELAKLIIEKKEG